MTIKKAILKNIESRLRQASASKNERRKALRIAKDIIENKPDKLPVALQNLTTDTRRVIMQTLEDYDVISGYYLMSENHQKKTPQS